MSHGMIILVINYVQNMIRQMLSWPRMHHSPLISPHQQIHHHSWHLVTLIPVWHS